jgi:hypothetical protein
MDLRHAIDLSPHDKTGNSFNGLTRNTAKIIGIALISLAVLMALPPSATPDDLINVFLTRMLISLFPSVGSIFLMALTYTLIPFVVFMLGIWIYPYNTRSLFNGKVNAFQRWIKKKTALEIIIMLGIAAFLGYLYYHYLITGGIIK